MRVDFAFIAKSGPAIMMAGGVLFLLLDQVAKTSFGLAAWGLIILGIGLSLAWAGFFRRIG
jgi:hypothetical protein